MTGEPRCPSVRQRGLRKPGALNTSHTSLLAWERKRPGVVHPPLPVGNSCYRGVCCLRGNVKANIAVTPPARNPGCFVVGVGGRVDRAGVQEERARKSRVFKSGSDRPEPEKERSVSGGYKIIYHLCSRKCWWVRTCGYQITCGNWVRNGQ